MALTRLMLQWSQLNPNGSVFFLFKFENKEGIYASTFNGYINTINSINGINKINRGVCNDESWETAIVFSH